MTKKKDNIPADVLKQFNTAMYKVGDVVVMHWLGEIKIGYVKKQYESNSKIAYTVEVAEMGLNKKLMHTNYPCGIQIKEYISDAKPGCILHERTQARYKSRLARVHENTGSSKVKVETNGGSRGTNGDSNSRETSGSRHNATPETSAKLSAKRVHGNNSETRSLDKAIDRQRDFLNGFVKK